MATFFRPNWSFKAKLAVQVKFPGKVFKENVIKTAFMIDVDETISEDP
jgi:hypothetical protein